MTQPRWILPAYVLAVTGGVASTPAIMPRAMIPRTGGPEARKNRNPVRTA